MATEKTDVSGLRKEQCLRCKTVTLTKLERDGERHLEITFFECPKCRSHYALKRGKRLTFRWGHPISLVLYDVIFDDSPTERAVGLATLPIERISRREMTLAMLAARFVEQLSPEQIETFVREIRLELDNPTQQVRDILDCQASEEELRKYLGLWCEHIEQILPARRLRARDDRAS